MALCSTQPPLDLAVHLNAQRTAPPFFRQYKPLRDDLTLQSFLKKEIEAIFFSNKKVNLRVWAQKISKIGRLTMFEKSSCFEVYELITTKIEQIGEQLRDFLELSFGMLNRDNRHLAQLCSLNSLIDNKSEFEQACFRTVNPPVSKMFVHFYKHMCGATLQVCNLWRAVYQSIEIKDLQISVLQKSIGKMVLQLFIAPKKSFSPKSLLPYMSLANKCSFICADTEGVAKRIEYCKFDQQEMRKVLNQKKIRRGKPFGFNPEEFSDFQKHLLQEITNQLSSSQKYSNRQLKIKTDNPFLEKLKKQQLINNCMNCKVRQIIKQNQIQDPLFVLPECSETGSSLMDAFDRNADLIYQFQDTSSQEDDFKNDYDVCDNCQDDDLILENQEIEVQGLSCPQKDINIKENSTGIESFFGNEQLIQNVDFTTMKTYQLEIPPEFVLPEHLSCQESLLAEVKREEIIKKSGNRVENTLGNNGVDQNYKGEQSGLQNRMTRYTEKIVKRNQKYLRSQNSKRYLEEEKLKLEKYRKQLEKQKQELLKEVERFMKQKQRDECYYRSAANRLSHRHRGTRPACKCLNEISHYDFAKYRHSHHSFRDDESKVNDFRGDDMAVNTLGEETMNNQTYTNLASETLDDCYNIEQGKKQKKSKRQQKLQKKQERTSKQNGKADKQSVSTVQDKAIIPISQEEVLLNKYLQSLRISDSNRVSWRIGQQWLQKWRAKTQVIRSSPICQIPVKQKNSDQTSKQVKSPKKKKNRKR